MIDPSSRNMGEPIPGSEVGRSRAKSTPARLQETKTPASSPMEAHSFSMPPPSLLGGVADTAENQTPKMLSPRKAAANSVRGRASTELGEKTEKVAHSVGEISEWKLSALIQSRNEIQVGARKAKIQDRVSTASRERAQVQEKFKSKSKEAGVLKSESKQFYNNIKRASEMDEAKNANRTSLLSGVGRQSLVDRYQDYKKAFDGLEQGHFFDIDEYKETESQLNFIAEKLGLQR